MHTRSKLQQRLQTLHEQTTQTPLFNPVFQLNLELSRDIESRAFSLKDIGTLVAELECDALKSRAQHLHQLLSPVSTDTNRAAFRDLVERSAAEGFVAFREKWQKPLLHIVFTAHPTFLLNRAESDAVAEAASQGDMSSETVCIADHARDTITLGTEHDEAMAAIGRAEDARAALIDIIYDVARAHWPDRWRELCPRPFAFASWVGYDMDGRTDIGWATTIRYRLNEKARRLGRYAASLLATGHLPDIVAQLDAAAVHTRKMEALFAENPDTPPEISCAANSLTTADSAKIITLAPIITVLREEAGNSPGDAARTLLSLAAAMEIDGLGMGGIHFRVNSTQLHNAIRRRIDPDGTLDLASKTALIRMRNLLEEVKPLRSNFAALAIEPTTALRQFLAMVQILHHIDADAPIRMLIAECEEPQTVLAALYFARLFGIAEKVDVSPLFETESAMEHGARFLDSLLSEPAYRDYARTRGRVAIQTGFSDAGRFIGQIPAALAIERLHGRFARIMARHGLKDVNALIFNTHGESMGRGAHPASMADRLSWPMSAWARHQFAEAGITTEREASFQGGDGYLFFRTFELALATLSRIASVESEPLQQAYDPFYTRTDISLDLYRGIRRVQREHLVSRTYARAITAFGLGLINNTGSRKSRRQSDLRADRDMNLRQIRAIPHNAILQQLGYPVNVIAGVGTASGDDCEAVAELINLSPRGQQIMRLLRASDRLASIKSVSAYGELFNSAYWASRPYRGTETHLEDACLALAEYLTKDDRVGVFRRLASRLRVDGVKLHRLLDKIPAENTSHGREDVRRSLGTLHAIRLALMQHMFLCAVRIPVFSRSNDISRDDVLEMVFTLRIDEALAQLRRAFPVAVPMLDDYAIDVPSDYPDDGGQAYAAIRQNCIEPIELANALCLRVSKAIANHFGAHG